MGVGAARRLTAPDGREWTVSVYRFRRPPWRQVVPYLGFLDPDEGIFFYLPAAALWLVLAPIGLVLIPLLVFLFEAPALALWSLVSNRRWVEAFHSGPPASRMTWLTDEPHAAAVAEQVARQLELGYERIEPHNARFLGFAPR